MSYFHKFDVLHESYIDGWTDGNAHKNYTPKEFAKAIKVDWNKSTSKEFFNVVYHTEAGGIDLFFDHNKNLIDAWDHNDAIYRKEFMGDLLKSLGIDVQSIKSEEVLDKIQDYMRDVHYREWDQKQKDWVFVEGA